MSKDEWGTKRVCQGCGTKFYDFGKSPILCPICGATFDINVLLRKKKVASTESEDADILADEDIVTEEDLEAEGDIDSDESESLNDEKD
jgi:uncharacterized protein (TIGR02300 family)